jgi:hypothetical protein
MDAVAMPGRAVARGEGFYLTMAVAIAATVVGGFSQFALRGMVDVSRVPFWVHIHAAVFMAWTLLFLTQVALAQRGTMRLHRRLGWIAVGLAAVMVPLGLGTAAMSIVLDRVPPFFPPNIFVALNILEMSAFVGLLVLAVRLRRRTDWHKRLMLFVMIAIMGPAFGRILPMPLLGDKGGLAVLGAQMLFVTPIVIHDIVERRRVHAASVIGAVVVLVEGLAIPLLAATGPVIALTAWLAGR